MNIRDVTTEGFLKVTGTLFDLLLLQNRLPPGVQGTEFIECYANV